MNLYLLSLALISLCEANLIFNCNFDGYCWNTISLNISYENTENRGLTGMHIIDSTGYAITDVSSITNLPVDSNATCKIPFYDGYTEHYHCTRSNQCLTTEYIFKNCSSGKFFFGKTDTLGNPYSGKMTINDIQLPESGEYEMSFYILLFSNTSNYDDYIEISLKYESTNYTFFQKTYSYHYENFKLEWIKKTVTFYSYEKSININVEFGRRYQIYGLESFLGFDEVEIRHLNNNDKTTSTSSTPYYSSTSFSTSSPSNIPQKSLRLKLEMVKKSILIEAIQSNIKTPSLLEIEKIIKNLDSNEIGDRETDTSSILKN